MIDTTQPSDNPDPYVIPDVAIDPTSSRVNPNEVATGVGRGVQYLGSDQIYSDAGNQQIVVASDNVPEVLMGNQATFGDGLYVARPGVNATTNTDPDGWLFNSNRNIYTIVKTIPISQTITHTSGTSTDTFGQKAVSYGLNYVPKYDATVTIDPVLQALSAVGVPNHVSPAITYGLSAGVITIFSITEVTIDATSIYLSTQLAAGLASGTYTFSATVTLQQQTFAMG